MGRWFNISGTCKPEKHYMLPPTKRLPKLSRLIEQESYFVIHAPRQTGKTTAMLALAKELTESGLYTAITVSVEVGEPFSDEPTFFEIPILDSWNAMPTAGYAYAQFDLPEDLRPPDNWNTAQPGRRIQGALQVWTQASPRPLVLFIDEIDSLQDNALISILRQLRDGYRGRPTNFPVSVGLIGLRDVRDYKVASGGSTRLNTASPFNIKDRSLTMRDFNAAEVGELYQQHTEDTGQVFKQEAIATAYDLTQGQPWLVNALAKEIVEELVTDREMSITAEYIHQAKEILISRQDTHLDSLAEKLTESRVKAIIEPMLAGLELGLVSNDDIQFVIDLGLCKMDPLGGLVIATPFYREVLPRVLTVAPMGLSKALH